MTRTLELGEECWAFVHGPKTPSGRAELVGAARVMVEAIHGGEPETYRVRVLRASGPVPSMIARIERSSLYACKDRKEHRAFGEEVKRYWPSTLLTLADLGGA